MSWTVCFSVCLSVCLFVCLSVSVCLFVCLSVYISLFVCLSVSLSVCSETKPTFSSQPITTGMCDVRAVQLPLEIESCLSIHDKSRLFYSLCYLQSAIYFSCRSNLMVFPIFMLIILFIHFILYKILFDLYT